MISGTTQGNTPANEVSNQVRAGVTNLTSANRLVAFVQPMPSTNYVVLLEPSTPTVVVSSKTTLGFTLSGHAAVTVGWLAVQYI